MSKAKLFTEVFAPKSIAEMILPDRIKLIFKDNVVNGHYLFHSGPGMGKSRLAFLLCQMHPHLFINASINGRIENLRDDIMDFCMEAQIDDRYPFGMAKVVWIDEIDGVSASFFDGLRGFMDTFQGSGIRFIATCNHFNKIPEPIQSRFDCINFGFENNAEEAAMFASYSAKMDWILNGLKIGHDKEIVDILCKANFPDYRGVLQTIQRLHRAGHKMLTKELVMSESYEFVDLYKLIIDKPTSDPIEIHKILMGDYATKAMDVLSGLDLPFIKWIADNKTTFSFMIPDLTAIVAKYTNMIPNMIDQALAMKACVFELMTLAAKKQ